MKRELSVFDKHQLAIAKKTMTLSDVGAHVMGGMTKEEAKEIIKKFTGKEYKESNMTKAQQLLQSLPEVKRVDKRYKMNKTYETWDEEAIEAGDTDDRGFEYEDKEFDSLWDMADEIRDAGATEPSDSRGGPHTWYSTIDDDVNIRTGERTSYAFHPDNLSAEEAAELFKLVKMDRGAFREAEPEEGEETDDEKGDRIEKEREKKNLTLF